MKEFFPVLHTAALFSGISDDELAAMLSCLGARIDTFPKGSRLLRAGESVEEVGLVLAGSALIVQEDIWGNRNILSKTGPAADLCGVHRRRSARLFVHHGGDRHRDVPGAADRHCASLACQLFCPAGRGHIEGGCGQSRAAAAD